MNNTEDRIYPATSADFPWLFDAFGVPYGEWWGLEFVWAGAVDLGEYTPPRALPDAGLLGMKLRAQERKTPTHHLDSPLTRHGQQADTLAHMRQARGFSLVSTIRYHWRNGTKRGTSRLYLQTGTEFWMETLDLAQTTN